MLKLNIYDKNKIAKTYTADTTYIMYGTIEDIIGLIDFDKLTDLEDKATQIELGKIIIKAIPMLKPMLKEIFEELTDEEIRKTRVNELVPLFVEIFTYAFSELTLVNKNTSKN